MPYELKLFRQEDKQAAAAEAGEALNNLLSEHKKEPLLLMLSSGSALPMLEYVSQNVLGPHITISVLDERFSHDLAVNNFAQLQKTDFYKDALDSGCGFFGTLARKEDTKESLANRWEHNLRQWKADHGDGKIFATLGMGPDGHTAGIFPFAEDSNTFHKNFESEAWITAYTALGKNPYPERVTTTITFLKMINSAIAYVCGHEKESRFDRILRRQGEVNELPALSWLKIYDVSVFTDIR